MVQDHGATGVCTQCGLELAAVQAPEKAGAAQAPGLAQALTRSIVARLQSGLPMEEAVAGALALHGIGGSDVGGTAAEPAGAQRAGSCPVCRGLLAPGAGTCGGCGLSLRSSGAVNCPNCGERADAGDGECGCGALLSLQAVEERFDATVTHACVRCKQLYKEYKPACRDCGGRLVSSDALRALFAR